MGPQFATMRMSDSERMQREYEQYLKAKEQLCGSLLVRKLTPSRVQERNERMDSSNQMSTENEMEQNSASEEDDEEYDSEGIDSIQLRLGSYDGIERRFHSVGYH